MTPGCVVLAALLLVGGAFGQNILYNICVNDETFRSAACQNLKIPESEVNCVLSIDSVDCSSKLKTGEAHIARFTPEEITLAAKTIENDANIIYETRQVNAQKYAFQMVALVKPTYNGGLLGLKGKNYCHPGFETSKMWTDKALKFFESKVVQSQCDSEKTALEEELNSISTFFNSSCRPGSWAPNDAWDKDLKMQYKNLCSLCDAANSCTYGLGQGKFQEGALKCLTEGSGDIAYAEYGQVADYINKNPDKVSQYKYLCIDGNTQDSGIPCFWYNQTWNAVVVSKAHAAALQQKFEQWVQVQRAGNTWQSALTEILKDSPNFKHLTNLTAYITEANTPTTEVGESCNRDSVKWCTTSLLEQKKCEQLMKAASVESIRPTINCVEAKSDWECFRKLQNSEADIMGINTNLGFFAKSLFKLKTIIYQEAADSNGQYISIPVIKADSKLSSYDSLKNKKACFPEFGGLAYLSFVETLRNRSIQSEACPYKNTMGKFFDQTCIPGAADDNHDPENKNDATKLCSLCPDTEGKCAAEPSDTNFYDSIGAMRCLIQQNADVAFIDANSMTDIRRTIPNFKDELYRYLCKDGSQITLDSNTKIIESCALSVAVAGEIVGRSTLSDVQSSDISSILLKMDDKFGFGDKLIFKMYEPFENTKNLLFKSNTIGLLEKGNTRPNIDSYITTIDTALECSSGLNLKASERTLVLTLATAVFTLVLYKN